MFDRSACRGDRNTVDDSLESMPSGHSTAAWAGFLFLYFYLNAKLKVFSNHHPAFWKLIVLYAPLLGATLITGSLTIDEFHNWYDCLAGAIIGSVFAISAYRMCYASVWDFRFNHIPLTRHTPFSYGAGPAGAGGFETAVFTRKAGWGFEEAYGGAPFDAAHGLRGQAVGFNQGAPGRHGGAGIMGNKLDSGDVERDAAAGAGTGAGVGAAGYENRHGHHHGLGSGRHENDGYDTATGTHVNNMHNSGGGLAGHGHTHGAGMRNDGLARNDGLNVRNDPLNTDTRNDGLGTRNDGVTTNRDLTGNNRDSMTGNNRRDSIYANEPTGMASDGRYQHHNRSLERKRIGNSAVTGQGTDQSVGGQGVGATGGALGGRSGEY